MNEGGAREGWEEHLRLADAESHETPFAEEVSLAAPASKNQNPKHPGEPSGRTPPGDFPFVDGSSPRVFSPGDVGSPGASPQEVGGRSRARAVGPKALEKDAEYAVGFLRLLGVDTGVDWPFPCLLPGHRRGLFARVSQAHGRFVYVCGCDGKERARWLTEAYAAYVSGGLRRRGPPEFARWGWRLAVEVGAVDAPAVAMPPLPADASETLRRVYEDLALFVRVRRLGDAPNEPFTFAKRFVAEWCGGLNEDAAKRALAALVCLGVLVKVDAVAVGGSFPANLYMLGTVA